MYKEDGCITIDHYKSDEIGTPYYFVDADGSNDEQRILRKWMSHFKTKDHPFAVLYNNKTRITKLVTQRIV